MGADDLNIDRVQMRKAGGGIEDANSDLRTHLTGLHQELAAHGQPWGNDDLGSLIGSCYQAIHETAFGSYGDNSTGLGDHGQKVTVMAGNYQQSEDANTGNVGQVI